MSVLIKTMTNLPERCYECPCYNGERSYCQADKEHRYSDYRPFWCPLVETSEERTIVLDYLKSEHDLDTDKLICSLDVIVRTEGSKVRKGVIK